MFGFTTYLSLHAIWDASAVMICDSRNCVGQLIVLAMITMVLTYNMASVVAATMYTAVKVSDTYVIPTSMAPNVGPSFDSTIGQCAVDCNALQAGQGDAICRGFVFQSTGWGQPTAATGSCQPVTFVDASQVVLKFDKTGIQRFFADAALFADAGRYELTLSIIY